MIPKVHNDFSFANDDGTYATERIGLYQAQETRHKTIYQRLFKKEGNLDLITDQMHYTARS